MKAYYATGKNGSVVELATNRGIEFADTVSGETNVPGPSSPDEALVALLNEAEATGGTEWTDEPLGDFTRAQMEAYVGA